MKLAADIAAISPPQSVGAAAAITVILPPRISHATPAIEECSAYRRAARPPSVTPPLLMRSQEIWWQRYMSAEINERRWARLPRDACRHAPLFNKRQRDTNAQRDERRLLRFFRRRRQLSDWI